MNICRRCKQDFSSISMFDRHRVGKHEYLWSLDREDGRRCLDTEEMPALGWVKNPQGRWFDPRTVDKTRKSLRGAENPYANPTEAS